MDSVGMRAESKEARIERERKEDALSRLIKSQQERQVIKDRRAAKAASSQKKKHSSKQHKSDAPSEAGPWGFEENPDAVAPDILSSQDPSSLSTTTHITPKSMTTMDPSYSQSTSHPHLKRKAAMSDEGTQEAKKTKLDKEQLGSGFNTSSNDMFKGKNRTPEEKKQSRAKVTEKATKGGHKKPEIQMKQPLVSTQKPSSNGVPQGKAVAPKTAVILKDGAWRNIAQPVVRKQIVRVDSPDTSKKLGPRQKAGVAPPKGTTPAVPQAQVLAPKAVSAVNKSIVWNKAQQPKVRTQEVRVEEELKRPARKRKMDVTEDATPDRPPKRSITADGQKRTSPPQTKKPDTSASSLAKAKESIKDVTAHTTEDAVADSDSMSSAEAQAASQASTTEHVNPAAIHIDASSSSTDLEMPPTPGGTQEADYDPLEHDSAELEMPPTPGGTQEADHDLFEHNSAELEMPPTPGYAQEDDYDLFESGFATRMAKATNQEAEDAPKSSEESTRALDSLFVESSSALDSILEDPSSDLESPTEEKPNGSSKATTPDSQPAKTTSVGANLNRGHEEKVEFPRGIINRKQSCFAASVLQALLSIGPFTKFYKMFTDPSMMQLLRGLSIYMQNINRWTAQNPLDLALKESRMAKIRETLRVHLKAHINFRTALGEVLRQISMPPSDKHHPFDPAAFLQVVGCLTEVRDDEGNIVPVFNGDEVADASEFLAALFDLLMMEEIRKSKKSKSGNPMSTKIEEILGGTTTQVLKCSNCRRTSESEIAIRSPLTTTMPKDIQDPTLEDCLDKLFERKEYVEGLECEYCEIEAVAKTTYGEQLPKYLAIQINRIESDQEGQQSKRNDDLRIDPSKTIDMSRWWPDCGSETAYEVCAIVEHEGEYPYDGHYWALRKDKDGRWHKFDDHKVTEICAESIPTEHCRGCLVFLRKPE